MKIFLSLFVLVGLLLAACSSSGAIRSDWEHRILTSGETSSREYREEGLLLYRDRLVPPAFSTILCPVGAFVYRRPHALVASFTGWLRDRSKLDSLMEEAAYGETMSKDEIARGWYAASWDQRRKGTPPDWVWVSFTTKGYWLKPQGLYYYSEILAPPQDARP